MRLIYVPVQQSALSSSEYVSGPDGIFETQAKRLGVQVVPIRPHGRILDRPAKESERLAWMNEQVIQLAQMIETGFMTNDDVVYFEALTSSYPLSRMRRQMQEVGIDARLVVNNNRYPVFDGQLFRKLYVGEEDITVEDKDENRVAFVPHSEKDLKFFYQFVNSVHEDGSKLEFDLLCNPNSPGQDLVSLITRCPNVVVRPVVSTDRIRSLTQASVLFGCEAKLELLEATALECVPLFADYDESDILLESNDWHLYKKNNVFDAKLHLYALMKRPWQSMNWVYRKAEFTTQWLLHDFGFDVPDVKSYSELLSVGRERSEMENYR